MLSPEEEEIERKHPSRAARYSGSKIKKKPGMIARSSAAAGLLVASIIADPRQSEVSAASEILSTDQTGHSLVLESTQHDRLAELGLTLAVDDIDIRGCRALYSYIDANGNEIFNTCTTRLPTRRPNPPTNTFTPSPTLTPTSSPSHTPTLSPTLSPSPSRTPTRTPTQTATKTATPEPTRTSIPEDPFYTQILDAFGLKIRGHGVLPANLQQARELVADMTDYSSDFQDRLLSVRATLTLLSENDQVLTDLPEFASMRGQLCFGQTLCDTIRLWFQPINGRPIAVVGEEYVFSYPGGIFHEFGSTFMFVFTQAERTDWDTIFNDASNRGLWPGSYGMQSSAQLWDELSREWFALGDDGYGGIDGIQTNLPVAHTRLLAVYGSPP